jgi:tetratricopeptide (TPR) repeat protein
MERGLTYYNSDAILQGVFDYTEAIKLDGKNAKAYYFRALAKLTLKNLPGALEDIEKAIQLKFNNAAIYDLRGIVQRKQGKIQDAITNFKKAAELYIVQKDKENAPLCLDKIQQLKSKSQPTPNIANSKPAAIISTQDYFTQLLAKAEQGDIKEVIADLNWIFKADSQDAHAYCCRGVVYYQNW